MKYFDETVFIDCTSLDRKILSNIQSRYYPSNYILHEIIEYLSHRGLYIVYDDIRFNGPHVRLFNGKYPMGSWWSLETKNTQSFIAVLIAGINRRMWEFDL